MSSESKKKLISLKNDWQHNEKYSKKKIPHKLKHLLESSALSDCEFIVGAEAPETFKAHKLLLAMTSAVFETMFFGSMAEKNPIKITDIEPVIFRKILEYIYTDTTNFTSFDEAYYVYIGAKKYMLDSLITYCVEQMCSLVKTSNACRAYKFAKFIEEPDLIDKCIKVFQEYTSTILKTDNYEDISLEVLKVISEQDCLAINSELILFNALEKYLNQNISKSDSHGDETHKDVLKNIRFLSLSCSQFANGPAYSPLLTDHQKLFIFRYFCSRIETCIKVPEGISRLQTPRSPYNH